MQVRILRKGQKTAYEEKKHDETSKEKDRYIIPGAGAFYRMPAADVDSLR